MPEVIGNPRHYKPNLYGIFGGEILWYTKPYGAEKGRTGDLLELIQHRRDW